MKWILIQVQSFCITLHIVVMMKSRKSQLPDMWEWLSQFLFHSHHWSVPSMSHSFCTSQVIQVPILGHPTRKTCHLALDQTDLAVPPALSLSHAVGRLEGDRNAFTNTGWVFCFVLSWLCFSNWKKKNHPVLLVYSNMTQWSEMQPGKLTLGVIYWHSCSVTWSNLKPWSLENTVIPFLYKVFYIAYWLL
jgi:hypothetical protein